MYIYTRILIIMHIYIYICTHIYIYIYIHYGADSNCKPVRQLRVPGRDRIDLAWAMSDTYAYA